MRCEDLFFSYGKKEILNGIGFCAQPGKILAIVVAALIIVAYMVQMNRNLRTEY